MPTCKYEYTGNGKNKGGVYELVLDATEHNTIICAGTLKHIEVVMYRDVKTHQVYLREKSDFHNKMKLIECP
jgi:hypothetical protein